MAHDPGTDGSYTPPSHLLFEEWPDNGWQPSSTMQLDEADDCVIDGMVMNTCVGKEPWANGTNPQDSIQEGSGTDPFLV